MRRHYGHLLQARETLPVELEAAKADLAAAIAALTPVAEAVQEENVNGATAVAKDGATTFFNTLRLELATDAGKLLVALEIAEAGLLRGCSDFEQVVACPKLREDAAQFRSIAFDGDSGKLTLEAELVDPSAVGFAAVPRGEEPEKFNEIDPESLRGKFLRLEIYANRLGDNFRFITGKAFLTDASGNTLHEGSFSADTYPTERSRLEL